MTNRRRAGGPRGALSARFRGISTCDVSDALDRLGLRGTTVGIVPLWPCPRIAGPAATLKLARRGPHSTAFGTLELIRDSRRGDVLVIDNGGRLDVNSWGGIATFTAARKGIAGVVIDGATRDLDEMKAFEFPCFARGVVQTSVRNRTAMIAYNVPVRFGGNTVRPGDYIVADDNGVVVVPRARALDVLALAERTRAIEARVRAAIARGVDPIKAHAAVTYDALLKRPPGEARRGGPAARLARKR
jgi:regulator of RNase E activity RraA